MTQIIRITQPAPDRDVVVTVNLDAEIKKYRWSANGAPSGRALRDQVCDLVAAEVAKKIMESWPKEKQ